MENIDESKPTLLCGNHTNAFLEGVLIAANYPNAKLYFLARADVFNHPLAAKILDKLPLFRSTVYGMDTMLWTEIKTPSTRLRNF